MSESLAAPVERVPFAYATIRVVPRVERGECVNAGVVLFSRSRRFLEARIHLDETRLAALAPGFDAEPVRTLLERIPTICAGGPGTGPIGALSQAERFNWLVAPSSTVIQPGSVHSGLTDDPAAVLEHLFRTLVLVDGTAGRRDGGTAGTERGEKARRQEGEG